MNENIENMKEKEERTERIIMHFLNDYGPYSYHKEKMAWAATALNCVIMIGVIGRVLTISFNALNSVILTTLTVITSWIVFLFVQEQLKNKEVASNVIDYCTNHLFGLYNKEEFFNCLKNKTEGRKKMGERRFWHKPRILMPLAIISFCIVTLLAIWGPHILKQEKTIHILQKLGAFEQRLIDQKQKISSNEKNINEIIKKLNSTKKPINQKEINDIKPN